MKPELFTGGTAEIDRRLRLGLPFPPVSGGTIFNRLAINTSTDYILINNALSGSPDPVGPIDLDSGSFGGALQSSYPTAFDTVCVSPLANTGARPWWDTGNTGYSQPTDTNNRAAIAPLFWWEPQFGEYDVPAPPPAARIPRVVQTWGRF